MTFIKIPDDQRPLCPMIVYPGSDYHATRNRILDTFYKNIPKDDDGEVTGPAADIYYKVAYENDGDRMFLYHTSVQLYDKALMVEAWWFKCLICGFVLPATSSAYTANR